MNTPGSSARIVVLGAGFGALSSVRLLRRLEQSGQPLGWFLSQVWDRLADRPFWCSQQAMRTARDAADVVLYPGTYLDAEVLGHCRDDARLVDTQDLDLDQILAVLTEAHAAGHEVVRLVSGDPSLYSAVAEQARRLDVAGVPAATRVRDVGSGRVLPALLELAPEIGTAYAEQEGARRGGLETTFRRLDVGEIRVGSRDEVVPGVVRLLERRRRGR